MMVIMKKINLFFLGLSWMALASCGSESSHSSVVESANSDSIQMESNNEVVQNIMARRSIRKYQSEPIAPQTLHTILECGINAPNGQNKQSWEVRVVNNDTVMKEILDVMLKAYPDVEPQKLADSFRGAPVMLFIARDKGYDFSAYDCGLLAGNVMLSATSLGVGSICLGMPVRLIRDNPACAPILKRLNFSEGYELSLCVGLGYPDESPAAKPRDWEKVKYVD
jgi:nitroreductase